MNLVQSGLFQRIAVELEQNRVRFGDQLGHSDLYWLSMLAEEFGEVARGVHREARDSAINATVGSTVGAGPGGLEEEAAVQELVQVAAICVMWCESIIARPCGPSVRPYIWPDADAFGPY